MVSDKIITKWAAGAGVAAAIQADQTRLEKEEGFVKNRAEAVDKSK